MAESRPTRITGPLTGQVSRPAPKRTVTGEAPPLALFVNTVDYAPDIGDFIIWAGWFTVWYGVVVTVSDDGQTFEAAFEKLPALLFTMTPEEMTAKSRVLPVAKVRGSRTGAWSIMKHDKTHNTPIWYV